MPVYLPLIPGEKKILKENNIKAFSMHDVDKYGIAEIMRISFDYLGHATPLHLSFDVDALDPTVAPATGTPVRGGLTFREGHYICEEVFETGRLVSMDMVEVNPELGETDFAKKTTINVSFLLTLDWLFAHTCCNGRNPTLIKIYISEARTALTSSV